MHAVIQEEPTHCDVVDHLRKGLLMSLFLTDSERAVLCNTPRDARLTDMYWALNRRAEQRAVKPGLMSPEDDVDWWRVVAEYLTDAAMAHALKPSPTLAVWLRDVTLSIARRPVADWVGPEYRLHKAGGDDVQIGHLETAHICWALAVVLDLAPTVLTDSERDEVKQLLRQRGMPMCVRWLEYSSKIANWRLVLLAGLTVSATVLGDQPMIERAARELPPAMECFQPDGSYAESLQYGNYALNCAILSIEALRRYDERWANLIPMQRYAGYVRWAVYSHLYMKQLSGWPGVRSRALNFNDSAAIFRPTAELLLHVASRARQAMPVEAGLARWLFDVVYGVPLGQGPMDQSSFGLVNHFGFMALPLYVQAAEALSPTQAKLPTMQAFGCGDVIARDAWNGRTVLGFHGGGEPMYGPGHTHGDLNSFILVHNQERLLVDAGHCCYRNLIHQFDVASATHNTCTFTSAQATGWVEGQPRPRLLEQRTEYARYMKNGVVGEPIDRGAVRLLAGQCGQVTVIGSEVAKTYGRPISNFTRFCVLCGPHVLFVIDSITSDEPVTTTRNWLLNNRDDQLDIKWIGEDRLVARRGNAGMKMINLSGARKDPVRFAYMHDAYHCLPNHTGEGKPGSGMLVRWTEKQPTTQRVAVHVMIVDGYGTVADWHMHQQPDGITEVTGLKNNPCWRLQLDPATLKMKVEETHSKQVVNIAADASGRWKMKS